MWLNDPIPVSIFNEMVASAEKHLLCGSQRVKEKKKKRKQLSSYNTPGENNPKTTDIIKRSKEVKSHYIPQVQCPLEKLFFICWPGSLPSPCGNSQKVVIAMKNYKGTESAYGLLGLDIK